MKLEPGFYLQQVLVRRNGTLVRGELVYPDGSQPNDDPLHYHSGAEAGETRKCLISQNPEAYERGTDSRCDIRVLEVRDRTRSHYQHGEIGGRKTLSISRAAENVGVSRRTVYNWLRSGKIEYVRTVSGAVRIFEDTLWGPREAPEDIAAGGEKVGRETVSIKRACERAGVSRRTIHNWIEAGKIKPVRTASGTLRIFEDDLHKKG